MKTKPKSRLANTMTTYRVGAAMLATVGMAGIGSNSARAADGQVPFLAAYAGQAMFTRPLSCSSAAAVTGS
jgi:hypothetical protein